MKIDLEIRAGAIRRPLVFGNRQFFPKQTSHDTEGVLTSVVENWVCTPKFPAVNQRKFKT
eukprot:10097416-Karenia_brevis.AAC.1